MQKTHFKLKQKKYGPQCDKWFYNIEAAQRQAVR